MYQPSGARQKSLGAYYTAPEVVRFLVTRAIAPGASALDPACGDGRFLDCALAAGAGRVQGYDIDPAAVAAARTQLAGRGSVECLDSLLLEPDRTEPVDAVIGNPPFIRYQWFGGATRASGRQSAARLGAKLSELASSWAPFVLHAARFLKPGGRLAMVVPAEIVNTHYGRVTLTALGRHFSRLRLLVFERNLFDRAQTEACLLLAHDFGAATTAVEIVALTDSAALVGVPDDGPADTRLSLDQGEVISLTQALLTPEERAAREQAQALAAVRPLLDLGELTNGFVTGDNAFFLRRRTDHVAAGYPEEWLLPVARNSRSWRGLRFTAADLEANEARGEAHHLVHPGGGLLDGEPARLAQWLAEGEAAGVPRRYKCRVREPWWRVPGVTRADVLLHYMVGREPRAAANEVAVGYTNTLHGLRVRPGMPPTIVAAAFHNSLTLLNIELSGRSYGGGVLKLEPREAAAVVVPWPSPVTELLKPVVAEVDAALWAGCYQTAVARVDDALLRVGCGLDDELLRLIRGARERLVERRMGRARR